MIAELVAIAVPALTCYGALRRSRFSGARLSRPLAAAIAPGLGIGVASCIYFLTLSLASSHTWSARLDAAFWLSGLILLAVARQRPAFAPAGSCLPADTRPVHAIGRSTIIAGAGFVAMAVVAGASLWLRWRVSPHGEWDAWAIWNLRARAIWRGVPDWTGAFTADVAWSHPDYPLLVPLSVVRLWAYAGRETTVVPAVLAALFLVASTATVVVSVSELRGRSTGLLSGIALLAPPAYVYFAAWQCADIPLGFFVLAAVSLSTPGGPAGKAGPTNMLAAGTAAGLAAWTKNEGMVLLALLPVLLAMFPGSRSRRAAVSGLLAGAAPAVVLLAWFKLRLAPANYLFAQQSAVTMAFKLLEVARLRDVAGRVLVGIVRWGAGPVGGVPALAAGVAAAGRADRAGAQRSGFALLLLAGILGGYSLAYVVTPLDYVWQIATSFDRLFAQVWPTLVWGTFQLAGRETSTRA